MVAWTGLLLPSVAVLSMSIRHFAATPIIHHYYAYGRSSPTPDQFIRNSRCAYHCSCMESVSNSNRTSTTWWRY